MITFEEILTNIDDWELINPFTFKYVSLKFADLYTLEFYIELTEPSYYMDSIFYMSTYKYIQFLTKIFSKKSEKNLCENNSCNSPSHFCCSSCHKLFCNSCAKMHNIDYCELNISKIHKKNIHLEKYKKNMLNLKDVQKNWKICECKKGGGLVTTYCEHGLRCDNCFCNNCDNDYAPDNYRFANLDMIFLKFEIEQLDYNNIINISKNEIEIFNKKIAKLFLENKDLIENESRKKRFEKHFLYIRRHFISYQKIKFIAYNILKKNYNLHLRKLFLQFKYYKLDFSTFEYDKNLSQDKNISKLSNFFVNKKPIFFVEKKEKNIIEEISEEKKSDK